MQTYTKDDFFILYRGWDNKLSCYLNGYFKAYKEKDFLKLDNATISINGTSYKIMLSKVTKI